MTVKATSSIQVIARLSRLLDTLAAHDEPVSLKTLASATGLHPSTAFRILASLIEHGLVERSANGHYRLGSQAVAIWATGFAVRTVSIARFVPSWSGFATRWSANPPARADRRNAAVASNAC